MPQITFIVPGLIPPKSNYRQNNTPASRKLWTRIKNYQTDVGWTAMAEGAKKYMGQGGVWVHLYLWNQKVDPDNAFKCPIDGLKNVAFPDDAGKFIKGVAAQWMKEDENGPRTVYTITWEDE